MTLLSDLEVLIQKYKSGSYSSEDLKERNIVDKVKAILDDHETRIAALESP